MFQGGDDDDIDHSSEVKFSYWYEKDDKNIEKKNEINT